MCMYACTLRRKTQTRLPRKGVANESVVTENDGDVPSAHELDNLIAKEGARANYNDCTKF